MQCELCGKDIRGKSHRVIIEGTELNVCDECARYGHEVKQIPKVTAKISGITFRTRSRRRPDIFDQMGDELLPDYGGVIRRARESHGMSHEELALKIREKASLLKKIERGDLRPEDDVRKKLERVLGITLTEKIE
ncbi:TIGR00270 family protein [ANME-2 cluster archaeon]|nr:MAG: TIGR00270 family protein [ANME-2 cluster archaeon]RLG25017.1 MAG: TIGR00270 family protein [Methanosarcinales archaeon]